MIKTCISGFLNVSITYNILDCVHVRGRKAITLNYSFNYSVEEMQVPTVKHKTDAEKVKERKLNTRIII